MRFVKYWQGAIETNRSPKFIPQTKISIIIPARNEADRIADCIASIGRQNYPKHLIEVIVISDFSTDNTIAIAEKAIRKARLNPNNNFVETAKKEGKKAALLQGNTKASGDWIITLDADTVISENGFIETVYLYEILDAKIVTCPILMLPNDDSNVVEIFQSLDQAGLMLITGAGFASEKFYLANGAFLCFEKKVFDQVKGYEGNENYVSGDDVFLMEKIALEYPKKIFFLKNTNALGATNTEPNWKAMMTQRLRWASKNKALKNRNIQYIWGFVWLYCLVTCLAIFFSFINPVIFFLPAIILIGLKMLGDHFLLSEATKFFNQKKWMKQFFICEFFHLYYVVLVGFKSLLGVRFEWKNRKVER